VLKFLLPKFVSKTIHCSVCTKCEMAQRCWFSPACLQMDFNEWLTTQLGKFALIISFRNTIRRHFVLSTNSARSKYKQFPRYSLWDWHVCFLYWNKIPFRRTRMQMFLAKVEMNEMPNGCWLENTKILSIQERRFSELTYVKIIIAIHLQWFMVQIVPSSITKFQQPFVVKKEKIRIVSWSVEHSHFNA
jgi:hypothetical protein